MVKSRGIDSAGSGLKISVSKTELSKDLVARKFPKGGYISARVVQQVNPKTFIANFQGLNLVTESDLPFKEGQFIFGKVLENKGIIHIKWIDKFFQSDVSDPEISSFLKNNNISVNDVSIKLLKYILQNNIIFNTSIFKKIIDLSGKENITNIKILFYLYSILSKDKKITGNIKELLKSYADKVNKFDKNNELPDLKQMLNEISNKDNLNKEIFILKTFKNIIKDQNLFKHIIGNRIASAVSDDVPLIFPFFADGEIRFIKIKYKQEKQNKNTKKDKHIITAEIPFDNLGIIEIEAMKIDSEIYIRIKMEDVEKLNSFQEYKIEFKKEIMEQNQNIKEISFMLKRDSGDINDSIANSPQVGLDLWI